MKINIRSNTDAIVKEMGRVAKKQVPYATSKAINAIAKLGEEEIKKQINSKIDNPVAYTKKSTFVKYSNKNDKPISAIVGIKDKQAEYMIYLEEGGVSKARRKNKPVPQKSFANKAGNIPRGKIARLRANKTKYFSGSPLGSGRPAGVYQRMKGGKLRQLATWVKETRHEPRTRFGDRFRLIVDRKLDRELRKQVVAALR